ncbi:carnitine O-acetyltransferase [Pseudonocardia sp. EC080610-09]|uniref:choline/carnitine O-acyltransferase n=1 Tax=unclassified Pseudonocardia TaxID=2619320 RepID=UPI0006CB1952|nr:MULTISPECIES: choline/carnitine O-acyltransferase [unclassified Pseudonocardia]ALE75827.1 carnitine O-acetyltransferase [Pseudonocardia sp. EC080625-04]ALL75206.1 carnitine O-acetyltransferase [Pseudonocardia sp. EC080610-09]ALL82231.1 carnitine O-acetyltransferase [Pseudonocardia sp. EC080619-01]
MAVTQPTTFVADDDLPKVPLPTLAASVDRFLEWCAPLLTPDEYARTEAAARELLVPGGTAEVLQADLERFDASAHSWLDEFWPSRYLGRRDRIALNANFFFQFGPGSADPCERAAELATAAIGHKADLDAGTFPPLTARGVPQSMDQSRHVFSTTRIPGDPQDTVRSPHTDAWPGPSAERHVVVFSRGRIHRLDVFGPGGDLHTVPEIADGLRAIRDAYPGRAGLDEAVGSLTTLARAEWAGVRDRLAGLDPANAEAVDLVERALFAICLDDDVPADDTAAARTLLAGDSGNRWFDKALSVVVLADGTAGVNIEHCELDGTTVLTLVDAMFADPVETHAARAGAREQGPPAHSELTFVLDDDLRATVRRAHDDFAAFLGATATTLVAFDDFGAQDAKALKCSPDAFVQAAYQVAHRRAKGVTGATYESIATRQFRRGRTEAMRVITPEMVAFVDAMQDPQAADDDRRAAFRLAAEAHGARAKQCQQGDAPEQHLWELEWIQRRRGAELGATEPMEVFASPGWTIMRDDWLSTSSAPSENVRFFGFGSTSSRCIGVAYVLLPDRFHVHLSTPADQADGMHAFARELRVAVGELRNLLA